MPPPASLLLMLFFDFPCGKLLASTALLGMQRLPQGSVAPHSYDQDASGACIFVTRNNPRYTSWVSYIRGAFIQYTRRFPTFRYRPAMHHELQNPKPKAPSYTSQLYVPNAKTVEQAFQFLRLLETYSPRATASLVHTKVQHTTTKVVQRGKGISKRGG